MRKPDKTAIRSKEDMPHISEDEGGNAYLINGNMIPLKVAMEGGNQKNVKTQK